MSISDNCLICGRKIINHTDAMHGVSCLGELHDLIINYSKFQKMLHNIDALKYPIPKNVTKRRKK